MEFSSAQWHLENLHVNAVYLDDRAVSGYVTNSRVAYGGRVNHTIKLDVPITVYGAIRDVVIVEHKDILSIQSNKSE